jgi:hypothetical protein
VALVQTVAVPTVNLPTGTEQRKRLVGEGKTLKRTKKNKDAIVQLRILKLMFAFSITIQISMPLPT